MFGKWFKRSPVTAPVAPARVVYEPAPCNRPHITQVVKTGRMMVLTVQKGDETCTYEFLMTWGTDFDGLAALVKNEQR